MANDQISADQRANEAFQANVSGGLKGALLATGILVPGFFFLQRKSPLFRELTIPLKAFVGVCVAVPCITINAEKAGEKYQAGLLGVTALQDEQAQLAHERWNKLTTIEKVRDVGKRYQWSIVGGSWVATMAVSGFIISRNKYLSFSQKLVQVRVVAQASTLIVLLASGALAGMNANRFGTHQKPYTEDHSWMETIKREEEEQRKHKIEEEDTEKHGKNGSKEIKSHIVAQ